MKLAPFKTTHLRENAKPDTNLHFTSIDGLRTISAIGIILMHIQANSSYSMNGLLFDNIIPFFTNFVFLFMTVSAFGLCCGYYELISRGTITPSEFYSKRYTKILPYFAVLVILDCILSPSIESLTEGFADLTLCFGLLPNANISVIGVGWFLGTIFVFYMLFPFFCFLLKNKRFAWITFVISLLYNIACTKYFMNTDHVIASFSPQANILFSSMFFVTGGLVYLYRDILSSIARRYHWLLLLVSAAISISYFGTPAKNDSIANLWMLVMFTSFLIYALNNDNKFLSNSITKFLSSISMEIYLSHMVIFRAVDQLHLNYAFGTSWISYIATFAMVFIGTIIFSLCVKCFLKLCRKIIRK